jgi:hydroxymethylpyrimidine/phosphomethylpyrimidine kinase
MKHNNLIRAGMNIKHSERLIKVLEEQGLIVSFYDRREEPPEIKEIEGMSTTWGAEQAIKKTGRVPNIIYHTGDWGKEPMITILGKNAVEVAKMAVKIAKIR